MHPASANVDVQDNVSHKSVMMSVNGVIETSLCVHGALI